MPLTAFLAPATDSLQRRWHDRRPLRLDGEPRSGDSAIAVIVHDLSSGGVLVGTDAPLTIGATVEIGLPVLTATARIVWNEGSLFGCQFVEPLTKAQVSAALLRSQPAGATRPTPLQGLADKVIGLHEPKDEVVLAQRPALLEEVRPLADAGDPAALILQQEAPGSADRADEAQDQRASFSNRLRIILLASALGWAAIFWVIHSL